jgi:hypothetical protein
MREGLMRIGIHLPHIGRKAGPKAIRRAAIQAEELGCADAWMTEHIIIALERTSKLIGLT